jgi:hypothetical protein
MGREIGGNGVRIERSLVVRNGRRGKQGRKEGERRGDGEGMKGSDERRGIWEKSEAV